jgi:uncharacterized membrane protein
MSRKTLGGILVVIGLILIVAGIVVMFVIVPSMKVWPDDVDTTRTYDGSFAALLDPTTLQTNSFDNVNIIRHVKTEEVDGDYALVSEDLTMMAGETQLAHVLKYYALDRETMEAVTSGFPDEWREREGYWELREGVVLSWPLDTGKEDYQGWSDDYGTQVPLVYQGEEEHNGINTYHYTAASEARPIHEYVINNILRLPPALPAETFMTVIENSALADSAALLRPIVEAYPEPAIPLAYSYAYDADYWIEPQTGALLDTRKHEVRTVGLGEDFITSAPALVQERLRAAQVPVYDLTYAQNPDSVDDATNDAEDIISQLNLFGVYLPAIMMIAGVLIIIVGGYFFVSRAKTAA